VSDKRTHVGAPEHAPTRRVLNGVNLTKVVMGGAVLTGRQPLPRCRACEEWIDDGQAYTLISLGPGADPAKRKLARDGGAYEHVKAPVHWACATGEEE
jgi:hypothetical protein